MLVEDIDLCFTEMGLYYPWHSMATTILAWTLLATGKSLGGNRGAWHGHLQGQWVVQQKRTLSLGNLLFKNQPWKKKKKNNQQGTASPLPQGDTWSHSSRFPLANNPEKWTGKIMALLPPHASKNAQGPFRFRGKFLFRQKCYRGITYVHNLKKFLLSICNL